MADLRHDIETALYREAHLLDSGEFNAWYELFLPEAIYWVPAGSGDYDPNEHVSIIHDDMTMLKKRIDRLYSGHAYAQIPASRTHRAITNVEVEDEGDGVVNVRCVMMLVELARHRQTLYPARVTYRLHRAGDNWRIGYKKVSLLMSDEPLPAAAFLF
ncbi:aromatic-ring-hydroxylating dioxygenase subunit beta [Acuticoccus mangrovi]|uniref:Aromatic-ring-hydroxylating dioxygenase subunit beta n=1 Tax=Acuticoccus mangrovi TaxID=2796142 RepID=A0A934ITZ2_9HYPH|nr:aromatic-ring-hydroxylating dioxygenase subunit beta [Acuticoccus mangrovi]MBJ3778132.1 aromatic-ring-hydroxylating dioxygenase subunit beta [Acuticoccus mangrovi]